MAHAIWIISRGRQGPIYRVYKTAANDLATQGARISTNMALMWLGRGIAVLVTIRLIYIISQAVSPRIQDGDHVTVVLIYLKPE